MQKRPTNTPRVNQYVRKTLALAQEEALRFRHRQIHPDHILLELIQAEGSITRAALSALNVTAKKARMVMIDTIPELEKVLDETLAREELATWNINLDDVLRGIEQVTPKVGKLAPMNYEPEFNQSTLTLMTQANGMVWQQKDRYFCTEHMLLALLSSPDERTNKILESLGLSLDKVQQALERMRSLTQEFKVINDELSQ